MNIGEFNSYDSSEAFVRFNIQIMSIYTRSRPIPVQCRICLLVHMQNEHLHILEPLFDYNIINIL